MISGDGVMPEASNKRSLPELTLPHPPTHSGFRWEECSEGLRLHFPPSDWPLRPTVTRWLCVVSLGAVAVSSVLTALGHPFGDRATIAMVVLAVVGGVCSLGGLLYDARLRFLALQECAQLVIGPEEVTTEDRAGRRQSWSRTTITAVSVTSQYTGDEPGNSQVCYVVWMGVAGGGPPAPLWSRGTRDGFPFFRETGYSEPNIRAATTWLASTIRRAIGLSFVADGGTSVGA